MSPLGTVAIVMPAFNEADGIAEFLTDLDGSFRRAGIPIVIGVIDDCSTDATGEVAERVSEGLESPVIVVANDQNRGHGSSSIRAWRLGLRLGTETIVHVDGDGQFSGCDVALIAQAGEGVDGVLGIRTTRADPWFRRIVTAVLGLYVGLMSGTSVRDPNTPLRAYRAERISELLDTLPPEPFVPSVYLSAVGAIRDLDIAEVEVDSRDRRGDSAVGSTWGESKQAFLPSRRFLLFVLRATRESVATLWKFRRDAGRA